MRSFLLVLIAAAAACGPARQPAPPPQPEPQPQPQPELTLAPPIVDGPITADSLIRFVSEQFPEGVAAHLVTLDFGSAGVEKDLAAELARMDIRTVVQFAAIVPADFRTRAFRALEAADDTTTIPGLVRAVMMIHDVRGYFTKAWNDGWVAPGGPADFPILAEYGVDFNVMAELGVFGSSEDEDEDEDDDEDEDEDEDDEE